ncbi:MAG: ATP-binding protein [Thermodesulfobacteriota bacterium]
MAEIFFYIKLNPLLWGKEEVPNCRWSIGKAQFSQTHLRVRQIKNFDENLTEWYKFVLLFYAFFDCISQIMKTRRKDRTMRQDLKILLVAHHAESYTLLKEMTRQVEAFQVQLEWTRTIKEASLLLKQRMMDVCFIDAVLSMQSLTDLLEVLSKEALACPVVVIVEEQDSKVLSSRFPPGIMDWIEKEHLTPVLLVHCIHYAIEKMRNMVTLRKTEQRLRVISAKLIHTQEEERKKLSRELHDNIGSSLTAIKLGLENVIRLPLESGRQSQSAQEMLPLVKKALHDLRNIYSNIRPTLLDDLGIIRTIHWYCRKFNLVTPCVEINVQIGIAETDVPKPLKIVIFRILQEALANIVKHSRADHIAIRLQKQNERIDFEIFDNGIGFDVGETLGTNVTNPGMGLESMKERAEFIGGSFHISSQNAQGTSIKASWPNAHILKMLSDDLRQMQSNEQKGETR